MEPGTDYVFDDVIVQASATVSSSQRATPEELVAMATEIWKSVKASGVAAADDAGNDTLLAQLQEKHKDFGQSFPLVLRWMVQARAYSPRAFGKYLRKHANLRLDSREEFLRLQAEYLVFLYRDHTPHASERAVREYRENIVRTLLAEDKEFTRVADEVDADMKAQAAEVDDERRRLLYRLLLAEKLRRGAESKPDNATG